MNTIHFLASPWWVNLLFLVPIVTFIFWRKYSLAVSWPKLFYTALFGIAFGWNEAVVVIYLRQALNLTNQTQISSNLPNQLLSIELVREFATLVMLVSVACLAERKLRERFALFLWTFAFWDLFYYIALFFSIGWPSSLLTEDVLFLIPVPWLAQVWFPVLVSLLVILSILFGKRKGVLTS